MMADNNARQAIDHRRYANIEQERVIDKYGPDEQTFEWPFLLANGPNGELIVGDNSASVKQLVVFDEQLQYLRVIGGEGDEDGRFQRICGITVDKEGFLYVTDAELNCIQKFRLNGEFVSRFGTPGNGNGQFNEPSGMTFSKLNLLLVCDRHNHRIQAFQGEDYFYRFGRFSNTQEPGAFNQPVDLTLNKNEDKLFVTDWGSDRVQVFEPNGRFLATIEHGLSGPDGIFYTPDCHLLVSSTNRVLVFEENGALVSSIEGKPEAGEVIFKDCIGVIMMINGRIVVADGRDGTNKLIVFQ